MTESVLSARLEADDLDRLVRRKMVTSPEQLHDMEWALATSLVEELEIARVFILLASIAAKYPSVTSSDPLGYPFDLGFLDTLQKVADDEFDFFDAIRKYATDALWRVIDMRLSELNTYKFFEKDGEQAA